MHKSIALEIIRNFSGEDFDRFYDFIRSPYFNKNSNAVRLFELLKKYRPDFESAMLDKEKIWEKLFPGKKYNYGTMKNLIFELKKLASKYLIIDELERNTLEEEEILVRALGKRNIPRFFVTKVNEIEKKYKIENLPALRVETQDYFASMFMIKFMKHAFLRVYDAKLAKNEDLQAYTTLMVSSFIVYSALFYNNIMAQSTDVNFHLENNALHTFLKIIKEDKMDELLNAINKYSASAGRFVTLCWLRMKTIMKGATIDDFYKFRDSVYENAHNMPVLELKGFFNGIVNAANLLDSPKINIAKERVDSLKIRMKRNMIAHDDGRIYVLELLQFFWSAGQLNDFEIIERLIKEYIVKSKDESRDNVMMCGEIYFRIRDGKFNEALELISLVTSESFMMKVHLRMLKVRCFYMTDDYDSFLYERDSLNHFLKSSKSLSEKNIRQLKDYFEKVNRMLRLKRNFEGSEFKKLRTEILSNENYPVWMKEEVSIMER